MSVSAARLAQTIRNPELPPWLPREPQLTLHVGLLDGVDYGRNAVAWRWTHPSGEITRGVPFMRAYSSVYPPRAGHIAVGMQFGDTFRVIGEQVLGTAELAVILG